MAARSGSLDQTVKNQPVNQEVAFVVQGSPPGIVTDRLVLDAHGVADFDDLRAMWADPQVTGFIVRVPATPSESWSRLLRYSGLWPLLGFGYWAVRERASGRYAGDVGFGAFHRTLDPPIGTTPEAGWVLASWAHGRGYATEATAAAHRWLDGTGSPARSVCLIHPDNAASLRVAARLGYGAARPATLNGAGTMLLQRETRR